MALGGVQVAQGADGLLEHPVGDAVPADVQGVLDGSEGGNLRWGEFRLE